MPAPAPVRLKDIAQKLGLDKSTVSLALRDHPRIPEKTRRRIKKTAEEMGYQPDPALRRLAAMRWKNASGSEKPLSLALLVAARRDYPGQRQAILPFLTQAARKLGYGFEGDFFLEDYPTPAGAARVLEARGVRGLLVMCTHTPEVYQSFPWNRFSAVQVLSAREEFSLLPVVRHDPFSSLLDAGRRVIRARPASAVMQFYFGEERASVTDLRYQSAALLVQRWWEEAGVADRRILHGQTNPANIRMMAAELRRNLPEILVAQNCGIVWALQEEGIRIPEDLKMIALSLDSTDTCGGYQKSFDQIAQNAVRMVDGFIRSDTRPPLEMPQVTVIGDRWIPGTSFPEPEDAAEQQHSLSPVAPGKA